MIGEHNMAPIKKGDTYVVTYSFYEDECENTPLDVSTYSFKLMAKKSDGTTVFTWTNSDFASVNNYTRKVTLTPGITYNYEAGEFVYELQVVISNNSYTWMQGYVEVQNEVTL